MRTAAHLVTIMIPTYNQARYTAQAVESAFLQSYANIEVVVSDDASADNTREVMERFKGERVFRYHRNAVNIGRVGNYRRLLYELAKGDLMLNLDGDDLLADPNYIAQAVDLFEQMPDLALVFADKKSFTGDPPSLSWAAKSPVRLLDGKEVLLNYWRREFVLNHLTAIYKRADAMAIDFYSKDIISTDMESLLRLIYGRRIAKVETIGGFWRHHGSNASVRLSVSKALMNLSMIESIYEFLRVRHPESMSRLDRWRRRFLKSRIYGLFTTHFWDKKRYWEGFRFLARVSQQYCWALFCLAADLRFSARLLFPPIGPWINKIKSLVR